MSEITAARLRERREALGLGLRDLGRASGIPHNTLSRIERGHMAPTERTLRHLADALEVSVAWLRGATDDPEPAAELLDLGRLDDPDRAILRKLAARLERG